MPQAARDDRGAPEGDPVAPPGTSYLREPKLAATLAFRVLDEGRKGVSMSNQVELLPKSWFDGVKKALEEYWEATPWQAGGDFAVKRLEKGLKTHARLFRECLAT